MALPAKRLPRTLVLSEYPELRRKAGVQLAMTEGGRASTRSVICQLDHLALERIAQIEDETCDPPHVGWIGPRALGFGLSALCWGNALIPTLEVGPQDHEY